jgi:hypothetical protein
MSYYKIIYNNEILIFLSLHFIQKPIMEISLFSYRFINSEIITINLIYFS